MNGITINDLRKALVDFSQPYMRAELFMFVRAGEARFKDPAGFRADAACWPAPSAAPPARRAPRWSGKTTALSSRRVRRWCSRWTPLGNDFISMIKDSALVSALGVGDITQMAKVYAGNSFLFFETYNVVAWLYLLMTIGLSLALRALERRLRTHEHR